MSLIWRFLAALGGLCSVFVGHGGSVGWFCNKTPLKCEARKIEGTEIMEGLSPKNKEGAIGRTFAVMCEAKSIPVSSN